MKHKCTAWILLLLACSYTAQADQLDGLKGLVPLYVSGISFFALLVLWPLVMALVNSAHWLARTVLFIIGALNITAGIMGLVAMADVAKYIQPVWNIISFVLAGILTLVGLYALYRVVKPKLK